MTRRLRVILGIAGALLALLGVLALAALVILPSAWFREKVRERIVYEVERASGGRAEVGSFQFDWKTLTADVRPFVLHGTETAGQNPLVRIESLKVGLKIISLWKEKFDLSSVDIQHPEINILVDANGHTNFPEPKMRRQSKDPIQQILNLAVKRITIRNGFLHYSDRVIPIDLNGENLNAILDYDLKGPKYAGDLGFEKLTLNTDKTLPLALSVATKVTLSAGHIVIPAAHLATPKSTIEASGAIITLKNPSAAFDVNAVGDLSELAKPLRIPGVYAGVVRFQGKAAYDSAQRYTLTGAVQGRQVSLSEGPVHLRDAALSTNIALTPDEIRLRAVEVHALGGFFHGTMDIREFQSYRASGDVSGFTLQNVAQVFDVRDLPWSATLSGPVDLSGSFSAKARDFKGSGTFSVAPAPGKRPVAGSVQIAYDQKSQTLQLGQSHVETPATRLDASGTLGQILQVTLHSADLNDVLPALTLVGDGAPASLPVHLESGGTAVFSGTVTGPINAAEVAGTLRLTRFGVEDEKIDGAEASFTAGRNGARISSLALGQQQLRLTGSAQIGFTNWKITPTSPISGNLRLQNASLGKLIASQGQKLPIDGLLSATVNLQGTSGDPKANINIIVEKPSFFGERFDRFRGEVRYAGAGIEVGNGSLEEGPARILLSGAYDHRSGDYKNGTFRFQVTSKNVSLQQIEFVHDQKPDLQAQVDVHVMGRGTVKNLEPLLSFLEGQASLQNVGLDGKPIGNFSLDARTSGNTLTVGTAGDVRGAPIHGNATFQLTGDYPGRGQVDFAPLSLSALRDLSPIPTSASLPFDGVVSGKMTFEGPARKPELLKARIELARLEIVSTRQTRTVKENQDLSLHNAVPIVLSVDGKSIHIDSAQFLGTGTNLSMTGTVALQNTGQWDLSVKGGVNLAVLQNFEPDLVSSGISTVNATVRGTLKRPMLNGQMELKDTSFYLRDIPNGIDKANGVIRFDQNRATIDDRIRAQTGGGDISLAGFVGYGTDEINYNLQAQADNVRVRYPEGVSTTLNATLAFSGTSQHSLLSGQVTVRRAGFNPRTDLGSLLAAASKPVSTPTTPNEFLRGVQLDVRVESAPNLQFQTTLTNNLQAEADLRLRGSAVRPVLGGHIAVNEGDIQFFGNKYTINRGDIYFYNPAKIEPVLDMDVETTIRGIVVTINFQGPLSKLNVSYRSDPPLQSSEIIALLTVGRAPSNTSSLASSQTVSQNSLASGTNTLLGQAVSAPVSSRLQRFFGVSRLKIDPLLTGVNAVPQARLTVEQQISKEVTLTYITNLTQANQQLVRVEWNLNRNWSVIAVREENGVFGVDFLYKARVK